MINYVLIGTLSAATLCILIMLILAIKDKNKLIDERKKGIVDQYILQANCEKTIKKIIDARKDDPTFSESMEHMYLEEMNNFFKSANSYIDNRDPIPITILSYKELRELLIVAELFIKKSEISERTNRTKINTRLSGELPFEITPYKLEFKEPIFEKTE